jgi:hypothetical protein
VPRAASPPAAVVAAAAAEVLESEIDQILLKTSKRKGRKEIPADPQVRDSIRRRIAESRVKKQSRLSFHCPACTTVLSRSGTLAAHVARCCSDILDPKAVQRVSWPSPAMPRLAAGRRAPENWEAPHAPDFLHCDDMNWRA